MKKRLRVIIHGKVQGVNFRWATMEEADHLGLCGMVRNTPDRKVEAVFEGDEEAIVKILDFLKKGPPAARVSMVEEFYSDYTGSYTDFRIQH